MRPTTKLGLAAFIAVTLTVALVAAIDSPHTASNLPAVCGECHTTHSAFGTLLDSSKGSTIETLCQSCHYASGPGSPAATHECSTAESCNFTFTMTCTRCHNPHKQEQNNKNSSTYGKFLKTTIATPNSGSRAVVLMGATGPKSFADDDATIDGICEVCHTQTSHHTNSATQSDSDHSPAGNCAGCHGHAQNFRGMGCTGCHATAQKSRRQIVSAGGDFTRTSHHVQGTIADTDCVMCHDMKDHQKGTVKLRDVDNGTTVYSYSATNPASVEGFCISCHDADGAAGDTTPFSDGRSVPNIKGSGANTWSSSAHNSIAYAQNSNSPVTCMGNGSTTGCHGNAHGSDNIKLLSAAASVSIGQFCYGCHTDGKVTNNALSNRVGHNSADDIQEAFGKSTKHALGKSFTIGSNSFTLQCTSCHNPHLDSGKYWSAASGVSPITRPDFSDPINNPRAMGKSVWGDTASEKMNAYVGSGKYQTPNNDVFTGAQLPDYNTFCLDCHSSNIGKGPVNWSRMHGTAAAGTPRGGAGPNWFGFGKGAGWDGDDCVSDQATCWPVQQRGKSYRIFTRTPYKQIERIANKNFVLACIDCHEAHGSARGGLIRERFNTNDSGGCGTGSTSGANCADGSLWNSFCNTCHYYYSDFHAGMSCGNASCHTANSIHRMSSSGSGSAAKTYDETLVLDYRFSNNLKDSGDWLMHGKWSDSNAGTFAAGQSGNAVVLDGQHTIQVGTQDATWSTCEGGPCGTTGGQGGGSWKYTHMKYNTTLEAWVYPTDSAATEYTIYSKHTGTAYGDYVLMLNRIDGMLRVGFKAQIDNNAGTTGGDAGIRGAYSTVAVPLNAWTHVAATFDTAGPNRSASDPTVGRIRIYVNGYDVTTSDGWGDYTQPGANETSIFAYQENTNYRDTVCYNGTWCAGEFSIGGFHGWQKPFIGRIDTARVWNVTKAASYFAPYGSSVAPRIGAAVASLNQVTVTFTEGVYATSGASGALAAADFAYHDNNSNGAKTITSVTHTAGSPTAVLTLSSNLTSADLGTDAVSAASGQVYDAHGNTAGTTQATLGGSLCPNSTVFQLNEAAGATTANDSSGAITGTVLGATTAFVGDGYLHGNGTGTGVDFDNHDTCFKATRKLTIEARFRPTGMAGTANYVRRIFARDSGGAGYQLSVWRNNGWATYNAPSGEASIAFWVRPKDNHGGKNWKPVLTLYSACPIVSDHWYRVKVVWDSDKNSGIPCDITVDDQGTDGLGSGEKWTGTLNCTDTTGSLAAADQRLSQGDEIAPADGDFTIGCNVNNHANNVFNGLIDWISWQR